MVRKIFLAKIFFTDLSGYKIRPILIIKEYKDEDFLYLPLTTNLSLSGITISSQDLESGNLNKPSVVIVPKISIMHKNFLIKEIGTVKQNTLINILKEICFSFGCSKI
ncbi:MAG: type II toxin-antitoxin system PemK/MazF family toxin [Ignavibacteriaceae bacterium]